MPRPAEFEEKEFEFPLFYELRGAAGALWTPGQVLEGKIGFDGAVKVQQNFWARVGRVPTAGVILAHVGLGPGLPPINTTGALPNFSLNVFVQAKRPNRYLRRTATLVAAGVGKTCWKFLLRHPQRVLLDKLASNLGAAADVCYGTPCFDTRADLFRHGLAKGIVANSHFPQARPLSGHKAYAYDAKGVGVALSEPVVVDTEPLEARTLRMWREGKSRDAQSDWTANVSEIWGAVRDAFRATVDLGSPWRETASELLRGLSADTPQDLVLGSAAALAMAGVSWFVLGPEHEGR